MFCPVGKQGKLVSFIFEDTAVEDGVDLLSLSIGGRSHPFFKTALLSEPLVQFKRGFSSAAQQAIPAHLRLFYQMRNPGFSLLVPAPSIGTQE